MSNAKNSLSALKGLSEQSPPPRVIGLVSPDMLRIDRAASFLVNKWVEARQHTIKPTCISIADIGSSRFGAIKDAIQNSSLFEPFRVWCVKDAAQPTALEAKNLLTLAGHAPSDMTLIVGVCRDEVNKTHPIRTLEAKGASIVTFEPLSGYDLKRWAVRELETHGLRGVGDHAIAALIDAAEGSLEELARKAAMLALWAGEEPVTKQQVEQLFPTAPTTSDFELLDRILSRNELVTEELIVQLHRKGRNLFGVLALLARGWQNSTSLLHHLHRGKSQADARRQSGMPPWLVSKYLEALRGVSPVSLENGLLGLVRADIRLKNRSLGADWTLSMLSSELQRELEPERSKQ